MLIVGLSHKLNRNVVQLHTGTSITSIHSFRHGLQNICSHLGKAVTSRTMRFTLVQVLWQEVIL